MATKRRDGFPEDSGPGRSSQTFVANMKRLRAEKGMNLATLSMMLPLVSAEHIHPDSLSRMESGKRRITIDEAVAIAKVFEVSVFEMCGWADPAAPAVVDKPHSDSAGATDAVVQLGRDEALEHLRQFAREEARRVFEELRTDTSEVGGSDAVSLARGTAKALEDAGYEVMLQGPAVLVNVTRPEDSEERYMRLNVVRSISVDGEEGGDDA